MFRAEQQIGNYILVKLLGRGGFGEVWLAERRTKFVTTKVAVKLPLDEQIDHETIKQEAILWEQASGHPNVLPIIEAEDYDGQVVIVSEYAPDGSLEDLLKKSGGMLPIKQTVEMTLGILAGLEFLHLRNIIHRDIKPANILLQGDTPRLADFGISRMMKTTSVSVNMSGTPAYMAPEAFDRKRTMRTDIWSVGVILYQMLKGTLPFPYSNITDLLGAIVMNEPESLPEFIPVRLQEIVLKALEKKSEERYQTAREMREDLADFLISISQQRVLPALKAEKKPNQTEAQTEILPTDLTEQTLTSPTIQRPLFVANTANSKLADTQLSNKILESPKYESPKPKPSARYIKILAPVAVLILLVAGIVAGGGMYLFINRQSNTNVLSNTTKDAPLISKKDGKKKIRYVFVSNANLDKKVVISDEELKAYYDSLPNEQKQAGVQGQEIVLRIANPNSEQQVLGRANQIIDDLKKAGYPTSEQAFSESAKKYSENSTTASRGGKLNGLVRRNPNTTDDPYQRLLTMQPGEITEPIKFQNSYFILRRGEAVPKSFEESKRELEVSYKVRRSYNIAAEVAQKISDDLKQTKDAQKTAQKFAAEANMNAKDMVRETPFIKPGDEVPDIGISPQFDKGIADLENPNDVGDKIPIKNGFAIPILIEKEN